MSMDSDSALNILLISIHGLIRGTNLELGRDADTGGQIKYVVELAHALAKRSDVARVELITRLVEDPKISNDYARPIEDLGNKVRIVRLSTGDSTYIRKEELWEHLDVFADNAVAYLQEAGYTPDVIHSHYADAGYIGRRLAAQLGIPLIHTAHSLGRVKRRRLLASGVKRDEVENLYSMSRRINTEEDILSSADLIVVSTHNEIERQYGLYDYYNPNIMTVVPPGTDLSHFKPPDGSEIKTKICGEICRFLRNPDKPIILALSRPDKRKNITTLIEAYGESPKLQEAANLAIVVGNRDDVRDMESDIQHVLTDILLLIDVYDLYGKIAYPKHHAPDDVPMIYRLTAASGGVFVNPALTEPFGLTLIEAAASGLPIVATEDGGPHDIIGNCKNGFLVDPLDKEAIVTCLLDIITDKTAWQEMSKKGLAGVRKHYSWHAHVETYIAKLRPLLKRTEPLPRLQVDRRPMLYHDRAIFSDLDQNLLGDTEALKEFSHFVRRNRKRASFGIATGRTLESALKVIRRNGIPQPDVLITSLGTEIYYAPRLTADIAWTRHIDYHWNPKAIQRLLNSLPGLERQPKERQRRYKISYYIDPEVAPSVEEINALLHKEEESVNLLYSFGQFLDIVPIRVSKGLALRYFSTQWGIPLENILAAGGSGADEDMMRGNTLAVVVGNRHEEKFSQFVDTNHIYFAKNNYARGIIEAIEYYDFYGKCMPPVSNSTEN